MRTLRHFSAYRDIAVKRLQMRDRIDADAGTERPAAHAAVLSSEQSAELEALLAKFDADQFNTADAQALVAGIVELGIKPSRALGEALRRAGFDPFVLAQKGNTPQRATSANDTPIGMRGQVNVEALDALSRLVENYSENDLSPDDWATLFAELEARGFDTSRPLVDVRL